MTAKRKARVEKNTDVMSAQEIREVIEKSGRTAIDVVLDRVANCHRERDQEKDTGDVETSHEKEITNNLHILFSSLSPKISPSMDVSFFFTHPTVIQSPDHQQHLRDKVNQNTHTREYQVCDEQSHSICR